MLPWHIFFDGFDDHRVLHVLTHAFPTRRSSDLAWWISWSPFVGMFIARVSRGRTVREFIVCVVLVPTVVSIFWMAVFGGTAIQQVIADPTAALQSAPLELQLLDRKSTRLNSSH